MWCGSDRWSQLAERARLFLNAFSKKIDNHIHALSLYFVWYNFVRIHKTLKVSPAMAAGISDRLWEMQDIVALMDARAEPVSRPKTYRKRVTA